MTIQELRQRCQPAHKQKVDPLMEWYILRPISIYFTWLFVRIGLRSNHVSFLGFACAAAGSGLLLLGDMQYAIGAGVLLWLGFVFDCVDGEVARYWGNGSIRGTYVDYLIGGVNDGMCLVALGFFISMITGWDPRWTVVPSAMLVYCEKVAGLYVQAIVVRYSREAWENSEPDPAVDYDALTWFEMPLLSRLMRVPFETFFRVTALLLVSVAALALNAPMLHVVNWGVLLLLSAVVTTKGIYSEIFQNRTERTVNNFANAMKSRAVAGRRAA